PTVLALVLKDANIKYAASGKVASASRDAASQSRAATMGSALAQDMQSGKNSVVRTPDIHILARRAHRLRLMDPAPVLPHPSTLRLIFLRVFLFHQFLLSGHTRPSPRWSQSVDAPPRVVLCTPSRMYVALSVRSCRGKAWGEAREVDVLGSVPADENQRKGRIVLSVPFVLDLKSSSNFGDTASWTLESARVLEVRFLPLLAMGHRRSRFGFLRQ
ncbi:hypothetical protein B0H13DRAFT_2466692, partial [Mycena leptocephala]